MLKSYKLWAGAFICLLTSYAVTFFSIKSIYREDIKSLSEHTKDLVSSNFKLRSQINHLVGILGDSQERGYIVSQVADIILENNPNFNIESALSVGEAVYINWKYYGVLPSIQIAIIEKESRFNPLAIGGDGEIGLFQVLPSTGRIVFDGLEMKEGYSDDLLMRPDINTRVGGYYLAKMKDSFWKYNTGENVYHMALTAYNGGPGRVYKLIKKGEIVSSKYSRSVISRSETYSTKYNIM